MTFPLDLTPFLPSPYLHRHRIAAFAAVPRAELESLVAGVRVLKRVRDLLGVVPKMVGSDGTLNVTFTGDRYGMRIYDVSFTPPGLHSSVPVWHMAYLADDRIGTWIVEAVGLPDYIVGPGELEVPLARYRPIGVRLVLYRERRDGLVGCIER